MSWEDNGGVFASDALKLAAVVNGYANTIGIEHELGHQLPALLVTRRCEGLSIPVPYAHH